jgi:hypothetical protein
MDNVLYITLPFLRSEKTPEAIGFQLRNSSMKLELRGSAVWEPLLQAVEFALGLWKLQENCIRFLEVLLALGTKRKNWAHNYQRLTQNLNAWHKT